MDSNTVSLMSERMLYQLSHNHYQMATILNNSVFKWAIPGLFFIYFRLFKQTTNICDKMSILYTVLGFELTPLGQG